MLSNIPSKKLYSDDVMMDNEYVAIMKSNCNLCKRYLWLLSKKWNPNFGLASQQLEVLADRSCQFVDDAVSLLGV